MTTQADPSLEAELDILARKAGVEIQPDRREAILAGYADLKRMAELVRGERSAAAEPANTYSLATVLRSL